MKFLLLISFCVLISVRLALEYDPRCGDPFSAYSIGTVDCSMAPKPSKSVENMTASICRKTVQTVYGHTRIKRACGYITDESVDKDCFRRSGTHDVRVYYCSCSGDLCNASANLSMSKLIIAIAAGTTLLLNSYISALPKAY